jgi:hypothetical protein
MVWKKTFLLIKVRSRTSSVIFTSLGKHTGVLSATSLWREQSGQDNSFTLMFVDLCKYLLMVVHDIF